jgi:hypothetical protein
MSALTSNTWRQFRSTAYASMPFPASCEEQPMRRTLIMIRDTLLVLAFQTAFRATQALRSLNY